MEKQLNHMEQRLYLHKYIYPQYIDEWLNIINQNLSCFFVKMDKRYLSIYMRIKKTEFRKNYGIITEGTTYDALGWTFRKFLNQVKTNHPEKDTKELNDIIYHGEFRLLISIVMMRNGDIEIRL